MVVQAITITILNDFSIHNGVTFEVFLNVFILFYLFINLLQNKGKKFQIKWHKYEEILRDCF